MPLTEYNRMPGVTQKKMPGKYLFGILLLFCMTQTIPAIANPTDDPFAVLRGKWRGSGTMVLKDKPKVRVSCNSQYTGSARQLILAIKCTSTSGEIDLRAKLSSYTNRLRGVWEEKTFRALGTISGMMTDEMISFNIKGNVWGKMSVKYTKSRQKVSITTRGITLESVKISMKRR